MMHLHEKCCRHSLSHLARPCACEHCNFVAKITTPQHALHMRHHVWLLCQQVSGTQSVCSVCPKTPKRRERQGEQNTYAQKTGRKEGSKKLASDCRSQRSRPPLMALEALMASTQNSVYCLTQRMLLAGPTSSLLPWQVGTRSQACYASSRNEPYQIQLA